MSTEPMQPFSLESRSIRRILSSLEQQPCTVLSIASARVYHTKLSDKNNHWTYSQWRGKLFFCRDIDATVSSAGRSVKEAEKYWFRLDDEETGRTVWVFKFPEDLEYAIDRPFFHVFQGRTRQYGFLFHDDQEAALFGKEVLSHTNESRRHPKLKLTLFQILANLLRPRSESSKKKNKTNTSAGPTRSKSLSTPISRSIISSPDPNSFKHVAHIGVGENGALEASSDLDESWKSMLANLQGYGVSEDVVERHSEFVEGFWKGVEAARDVDSEQADGNIQKEVSRKVMSISAL